MAAVAPPADKAADLLQKLSLDAKPKPIEITEPSKKAPASQFGSADAANAANGQLQSHERSVTPVLPDFMDPTVCYMPNAYPFFYGGPGGEWDDYSRYTNAEGMDLNSGFFGENGSLMYHHGYGYPPYAPYSPATSPVPGNDPLYGTQHYHYPSPYFQSLTPTSASFSPNPVAPPHREVATSTPEQKPPAMETVKGNPNGRTNTMKSNNRSAYSKSSNQNSAYNAKGSLPGGMTGYGFDGLRSPIQWLETAAFSDGPAGPVGSNTLLNQFPNANNAQSRNQQFRQNSNYMALNHSRPISGMGSANGFMNGVFPNKLYGHYGGTVRSGMGFGSHGYDSRSNERGWYNIDKYRNRGQGNGYYGYFNDNVDGLNELNRGPRAKSTKNQKNFAPVLAVKGQSLPSNGAVAEEKGKDSSIAPDREQYNRADFAEDYTYAKFFIIKSYSEDDVHKSIKYKVWASTPNGNKKLDAAYREAQEKSGGCPVFLLFSVNTSGQFVGLAEMLGPVDFDKNVEYWQQDKWTGCFPVKWHIVKDIPNSSLKHIILENNENKPVTNSRDTQEVKLSQGLEIIKIFKEHPLRTCLLDDFEFYENRQKAVQEKKAKQLQFQRQGWGKPADDKKEMGNGDLKLHKPLEAVPKESISVQANGDVTAVPDSRTARAVVDEKPALANGIGKSC
ncbi:hypothetical protein MLD38_011270 [Melastoma candidum]|uniref:Uncharacterized protein n=1 Tax=Melastoma candidum TaxID=119954 RepID=A0ACB9R2H9_9MYRT|nr:hypothetical protein MLD38_011270 [Melastoma candidum]